MSKKRTDMHNYMNGEMWSERVRQTISFWETLQDVKVPDDIKETIEKFVRRKIDKALREKKNLKDLFFQMAVTALIYIKMKRLDK